MTDEELIANAELVILQMRYLSTVIEMYCKLMQKSNTSNRAQFVGMIKHNLELMRKYSDPKNFVYPIGDIQKEG